MQNALIELVEQKKFDEITISDICRLAGVNRSTFYSHYSNKIELLEEVERDMILAFKEDISSTFRQVQNHVDNIDQLSERPDFYDGNLLLDDHTLTAYLSFVKEHRQIFRVYNDKKSLFHNKEHFYLFKNLLFKKAFRSFTELTDTDITYISLYYLAGIEAIVEQWINTDCNETEEEICRIIRFCILGKH